MKLNTEDIKKLIPHREPFLFVDTCEIIKPGEHGKSEKFFSANEGIIIKYLYFLFCGNLFGLPN